MKITQVSKWILLALLLAALAVLAACGSSSANVTSVRVTCNPANITSAGTSQCIAVVGGSGGVTQTVNWSVTEGTITSAGLYTAPTVTSQHRPVVKAVSTQNSLIVGTYQITIDPPGSAISTVTASCTPTNVASGQTSQCSAKVTGTGNFSSAVNWSVTSGTIDAAGLFTAPTVPLLTQVIATATSVQDPTRSSPVVLNVSPAGTISSVTVTCALPTIQSNQDSQCTATVNGTGNFSNAVTWTASPGTTTVNGLYVAPTVSTSTAASVTAKSVQDPTRSGKADLTVNPVAPGNNVVAVKVDSGPAKSYVNGAFASVTICVPGTSTCQTIDHLLVDTGSAGVRLLASGAAGGQLNLPLTQKLASDGNPLNECFPMAHGFVWGPVAQADVVLGGEQASNLPVQVIGQAGEPAVPNSCSNGTTNLGTLAALGANGILGVGLFAQDCGTTCSQSATNVYYSCATVGACNATTVSIVNQVLNPVPFLPGDNNGVSLQLPAVTPPGEATLSGTLYLGIGTQANNGVGAATAYTTDTNGNFAVTYNGTAYPGTISSGLNANYFLNSTSVPQLPTCTGNFSQYYCPTSTQAITATNVGLNGASSPITFNVDSASDLITNNPTFAAFPTLGGPSKANPLVFDWGLPFFYGRNVYIAIQGANTPLGSGPFWAY